MGSGSAGHRFTLPRVAGARVPPPAREGGEPQKRPPDKGGLLRLMHWTQLYWQLVRLTVFSPAKSCLCTVRVEQSPFRPVPVVSVVVFFSVPRKPPRSSTVTAAAGGACSITTAGGRRSSLMVVCAAAPSEPNTVAASARVRILSFMVASC